MASADHLKLSEFIKSIHKKLREEARILGTERAWKNHCNDVENLEKYASAMQQLAVNHWDKNSASDERLLSRITWVYVACKDYFANIQIYRDKELKIVKSCDGFDNVVMPLLFPAISKGRYKLLDVGSCYNPFKQFKLFEVIPIDIAPANKDVLKCDFLNLRICNETVIENQQFGANYFDIIVFSLLLEYFPSSEQRLKCCLNAYNLLKPEGILVIITPDSNHVGSNAKIFKSWQYVLAKHGFIRIKYEKLPYIHCMMFRKAYFKKVTQRWADIHASRGFYTEIFIPQDFTATKIDKSNEDLLQNKWNQDTFLQNLDFSISE